jgi:peptide/nickel transport system ATP-binding protein
MSDIILSVTGLRTWIDTAAGPLRAVDDVDFVIRRGETFALVGESGSGKSMTALSIMRLLPEAAWLAGGAVMMSGRDLLGLAEREMRDVRGKRIAMIFQEPGTSLNPVMTVGAQIAEVLWRHLRMSGVEASRRVVELLEAVGLPSPAHRAAEYPFQLSGGMKQRVMIAMALAAEPDLLIADEPTTALDVTIQAQVLELLRDLQHKRGMAMLLITHDLGIVSEMAHQVAVMYAGRLAEVATRDRFFREPGHPYSRKLFESLPGAVGSSGELAVIPGQVPALTRVFSECRFVDRCGFAAPACREGEPPLVEVAAGHVVRCVRTAEIGWLAVGRAEPAVAVGRAEDAPAPPMLRVRGLQVHFPIRKGVLRRTVGQVRAVDGVALDIAAGRTLALVGESGCGKTTAGKAIIQLLEPTAGSVQLDGVALDQLRGSQLRRSRRDFQIVFQDPYASLNPRMRVGDILAEGQLALGDDTDAGNIARRSARLLEQVGMSGEVMGRYPHEFSGGQRQRIAIARALAVRPRLLVCDEPTSALDVSVQAQILNLLKSLQRELGLSYLFITHNISVVEYIAHEVAVMYLGRIVERGTVSEVLGAPAHPYTRALLAAVPSVDAAKGRPVVRLEGELPSPANPPAGCHFHPRCPQVREQCRTSYPGASVLSPTRTVHCWLHAAEGNAAGRAQPISVPE